MMNTLPPVEGSTELLVRDDKLFVDGKQLEDLRELTGAAGPRMLEGLYYGLDERRDAWEAKHPGEAFPGKMLLALDGKLGGTVFKSIVHTVAYSGYHDLRFVVRSRLDPTKLATMAVGPVIHGPPLDDLPPDNRCSLVRRCQPLPRGSPQ